MQLYADYSAARPSGAALRAAGFSGVIRYGYVGSASKLLTAAEHADLVANGLDVLLVIERTTTDADGGYAAGTSTATGALTWARSLGLPDSVTICAANDKPGYSQADVDYVRGFRDVLGQARTGVYGFGAFLALCVPYASFFWQAGPSPSRTGTSALANAWQRNGTAGDTADGPGAPTTITVAGVLCDVNNVYTTEDDDMTPDQSAKLDAIYGALYVTASTPYGVTLFDSDETIKTQTAAIAGALPAVQTAILAALPAEGVTVSPEQLSDLETKLVAALPKGWNVAITPAAPAA